MELLCATREEKDAPPKIEGWCKDWLSCIKQKASPEMTPAAVEAAWAPADCKEYCGKWPVVTKDAGANTTSLLLAKSSLKGGDCMTSCSNFKKSLTTCVATILFEPGHIATMNGGPSGLPEKDVPELCTAKDTPCMPDLTARYQRCIARGCAQLKALKADMDHCHKCPQQSDGYVSHYASFVGGCKAQLGAYHQATHPDAGDAAIPGASGCSVH